MVISSPASSNLKCQPQNGPDHILFISTCIIWVSHCSWCSVIYVNGNMDNLTAGLEFRKWTGHIIRELIDIEITHILIILLEYDKGFTFNEIIHSR